MPTQEQRTDSPALPPPPIPSIRRPFFERRSGRILLYSTAGAFTLFLAVFGFFYFRYERMIDRRLAAGPFADTVNLYTAPRMVEVGDPLTPEELVVRLRRGGYTTEPGNTIGWYRITGDVVAVFPGRDSFPGGEPGALHFANGRITRIVSLDDNTDRSQFLLEPQLIANLSPNREKRRLVGFSDIPPVLVDAVVSAEDKRFFHHSGFDIFRALKAAYIDVKTGRKQQGASTLTMQLARELWLDPEKNFHRKLSEILITIHLEFKLSKRQIFEDYANEVYLGRHGTYNIHGFGEACRAYFGKDISQLDIPEAALLAGMIQRPSSFNPYRYPDRARERRDVVLGLMRDNGYLTAAQYESAIATPVLVTPATAENTGMQYFTDLVNDELQRKLGEKERLTRYVYTTVDPDLQDAAQEAVNAGMTLVDAELHQGGDGRNPPQQPQVALIALDPHTGEIKALVGGRNYGASQLNHALAMRQPGSVFKPIVYAAALESAIEGGDDVFTPASTLKDEPTTFYFDSQAYRPANFRNHFMGTVTLRNALAHSLNNATVELAEEVGYSRVVAMARRFGLNGAIRPTPAVALGAYDAAPLEIARAYTVFANGGDRQEPAAIAMVRGQDGAVVYEHAGNPMPALDARVNYLMVSMLEDVLKYGTGASVRARGFRLPAAGKTGTSRDGWFAGFTSNLLCVVWVGFDDGRALNLEGARSALPIWTEFMKRAARVRPYGDVHGFAAPSGVVTVEVCGSDPDCANPHSEPFLDGTQPVARHREEYSDRTEEPPAEAAPPQATSGYSIVPLAAAPKTTADPPPGPPAEPATRLPPGDVAPNVRRSPPSDPPRKQ